MRFLSFLVGFAAAASALAVVESTGTADILADSPLEVRQTQRCGAPGYRRSHRPYYARKAINNAKACGEKCWSEQTCKSYSFGYGTCSLFEADLSRNLIVQNDSQVKFYEKSCAAPPPPTYSRSSCKLVGYDNANARTKFYTKSSCNLSTCQALCKSTSRCQSYRHGQNTCVLFTAPVSRGFTRDSRSPYTFYDRSCQVGSVSGPSSTTASRVIATSVVNAGGSRSTSITTVRSASTTRSTSVVIAGTTKFTTSTTRSSATTSTSHTSTSSVTSTTSSSTTSSSTTTGSNTQETTIENVRIAFKSAKKRKRQTDGSVNLPDGYISRTFNANGQRVFTTDSGDALAVKITVPKGGAVTQTRLNLLAENSPSQQDLPALALVRSTDPSQAAQLFLGAAKPGAPPADGTDNSLSRTSSPGSYVAQSAIWTVNLQTLAVSAQWINADGSAMDLSLLAQNGVLFMTSDPASFPNADQLTTTASFADAAAACTISTNYEFVLGQCLEKCRAPLQRIPGTIICAQPNTLTCGEGQRAIAGLCICTDNKMQLFQGKCIPRCDATLKETLNYTTGQCGCRADMIRDANNVCGCPTGQQDAGRSCECIDSTLVLSNGKCISRVASCDSTLKETLNSTTGQCSCRSDMIRDATGVCDCPAGSRDVGRTCACYDFDRVLTNGKCVCKSSTATEVNGVCQEPASQKPSSQEISNVLLSFSLPASKSKRQDGSSRVDLGYGYISADTRSTGERYLTNNKDNALSVSFSVPQGSTTAQQINLVGPAGSSPAGIPTLALIFDLANNFAGVPFARSASSRLSIGSSAATAPGSLPQADIDNSMSSARVPANAGKTLVAETAVWSIDTTTGNLEAYWIDDTGVKTRMLLVTNGDNIFFAPESIYDQINATPLQLRAEIPGTTSPNSPTGPADCRTGTVQCPACPDTTNQCRAPDGTCTARDETGSCGYNCYPGIPGNADAPPSEFCWKCPIGYFGTALGGCTALPCPNPTNQFRNRTGCFDVPKCVAPQVYVGNGLCAIQLGSGTGWVSPKASTENSPYQKAPTQRRGAGRVLSRWF